jgi:hypothetical protein
MILGLKSNFSYSIIGRVSEKEETHFYCANGSG